MKSSGDMNKNRIRGFSYPLPSTIWVVVSYWAIWNATPGHNANWAGAYYKTAWSHSEITHYAAVSLKKNIQLHFHCICRCEFAWKWISVALGNRTLTEGEKKGRGGARRWRSSIFILKLTDKMWLAKRDLQISERCGKTSDACRKGKRMMRKNGRMGWRTREVKEAERENAARGSHWSFLCCVTRLWPPVLNTAWKDALNSKLDLLQHESINHLSGIPERIVE